MNEQEDEIIDLEESDEIIEQPIGEDIVSHPNLNATYSKNNDNKITKSENSVGNNNSSNNKNFSGNSNLKKGRKFLLYISLSVIQLHEFQEQSSCRVRLEVVYVSIYGIIVYNESEAVSRFVAKGVGVHSPEAFVEQFPVVLCVFYAA